MEAEFAHDERSALSLYDSLIPKLREHRKLETSIELALSKKLMLTDDGRAKLRALELQT